MLDYFTPPARRGPTGPHPKSIAERFWKHVTKTETCWLWTGGTTNGYGMINVGGLHGPTTTAHRVSWEMANGEIPDGLCALHNCPGGDNRRCVRPSHLFLGTRPENQADMAAKGRARKGDQHHTRLRPELAPQGERNGMARLTEADVLEIRRLAATGMPYKEIGAPFRLSTGSVSRIVKRERWKHV